MYAQVDKRKVKQCRVVGGSGGQRKNSYRIDKNGVIQRGCWDSFKRLLRKFRLSKNNSVDVNSTSPLLNERKMPSLTHDVKSCEPEDYVILARGTHSEEEFYKIITQQSAGGLSRNSSVKAPPETAGIKQAGMDEVRPGTSQKIKKTFEWTEYTSDIDKAIDFSNVNKVGEDRTRGGLVVIKIKRKYLTEGSRGECGWIAMDSAPVEILYTDNS
ncbi:DUF4765 family protein [Vibrio quintilis]|uniref:DUF4765 domain-containing protein n=1 Tax=Vibrio quintilis TaxID=1117707 RepID=A0A1M7YP80_9VIBR|nr:DUF4765 family protein [Vibrio quintilis]SHO54427.1 hypothetical protein VQ7734_00141 [Vibrio quintilis]